MTALSTSVGDQSIAVREWTNETAPRRCVNTVTPRGLADDWSID